MPRARICSRTSKIRRSRRHLKYSEGWEYHEPLRYTAMNSSPTTSTPAASLNLEKRFQSYRGTWAWLVQRISAVCLFLLIPIKIYTGWASKGKVPDLPEFLGSGKKVHLNA